MKIVQLPPILHDPRLLLLVKIAPLGLHQDIRICIEAGTDPNPEPGATSSRLAIYANGQLTQRYVLKDDDSRTVWGKVWKAYLATHLAALDAAGLLPAPEGGSRHA